MFLSRLVERHWSALEVFFTNLSFVERFFACPVWGLRDLKYDHVENWRCTTTSGQDSPTRHLVSYCLHRSKIKDPLLAITCGMDFSCDQCLHRHQKFWL